MKPPIDSGQASDRHSKDIELEFRGNVVRHTAIVGGVLVLFSTFLRSQTAEIKLMNLLGSCVVGSLLLAIPLLLRYPRLRVFSGYLLIFCVSAVAVTAGLTNGGLRAPAMAAFVLSPLFGFLAVGIAGARFGMALAIVSLMALMMGDAWVLPLDSPEKYIYYKAIVVCVCVVMAYAIGSVYERARRESEKKIYSLSSKMLHSAKFASL